MRASFRGLAFALFAFATLVAPEGGDEDQPVPITLTLNGSTITSSLSEEGFSATFTLSRSSTALPPIITSFQAQAPSITAGQSTTLRWDTFNATSVTIDNGLGSQGTSGSVTITPLVTTTYTLTATVSGGNSDGQDHRHGAGGRSNTAAKRAAQLLRDPRPTGTERLVDVAARQLAAAAL